MQKEFLNRLLELLDHFVRIDFMQVNEYLKLLHLQQEQNYCWNFLYFGSVEFMYAHYFNLNGQPKSLIIVNNVSFE